jgi:hypothetical protein
LSFSVCGFSSVLLVGSSLIDLGLILREEDMRKTFWGSLQERQREGGHPQTEERSDMGERRP